MSDEPKMDRRKLPRSPEILAKMSAAQRRRRQIERIQMGRLNRKYAGSEYWAVPEDFDEMGE